MASCKIKDDPELLRKAIENPHIALREIIKNDLYYFIRYFWDEYSNEQFVDNWHIRYICNELMVIAKRIAHNKPNEYDLIINIPPGTTKTAMVSIFYPLWCWANWHWMRFITSSYTASLAMESAEYSRDIIKSQKWRMLFPDIDIKKDEDTKTNFRCIKYLSKKPGKAPKIKKGGNRYSTSVGGSMTGFHGHINIVDDPIDPMRAASDVELKKANYWMDNVLPFRKVDKNISTTILIMQRLHQDDPTGHLLKERPDKIKHISLPGEIKNFMDMVKPPELIRYYSGELLDPKRLSWEALEDLRILGQYTYSGQVGQNPVPLSGGMFKVDFIQTVENIPTGTQRDHTVRYWDKAATAEGGAYTVGVKMSRLTNGKYLIEDVKRGQWSSELRERIIRQAAEADGMECRVYIEQEPGSGGLESARATIKNLAGYAVYADRPTGDKTRRADPFSVQVNDGNVLILRASWNHDFLDELANFPNSTFKDQVDAASGAFNKLTAKKKVKVMRK